MVRNTKGFTLIELMVVILIIGILAALAIPKFTSASAKAKISEVPTVMAAFENAQLARVAETGEPGAIDEIVFDEPTNSKWFTYDNATDGVYGASPNNEIGGLLTSDVINTTVTNASGGTVTHATTNTAAVEKLIPNFLD